MEESSMHNTIFITIEGGVIQHIQATEDLVDQINLVVLDFDTDGVEDYKLNSVNDKKAVVYKHPVEPINDGDIDFFAALFGQTYQKENNEYLST